MGIDLVAPGWLVLGVLLHVGNQIARGRGWYAIARGALGDDPDLRARDAIAAWVAGAGASGVASARGGDAVRIVLLGRRVPRAGAPLLAGTIVAEGAGELAGGLLLLAVAAAFGLGPELGAPPGWVLLAAPAGVAAAVALASRFARVRRVAAHVGRGCAVLRCPRAYARAVLPWQLVSRLCRLGALACFLLAFGLPATIAAVLLVTFAQGSGRLVPFAPASVGAGAAVLAATFGPVTGADVGAAQLAAFFVGTSTVLTAVGIAVSTAICARSVSRRELAAAAQALARAGRTAGSRGFARAARVPSA